MDALVNSLMEELNCETVFTIPIFGGIPIYESVVVTWIIMAVVIVLCILLTRNLSVEHPGRRQIILETAVNGLNNFFRDTIGENGKQYIPYLMTVAIYIGIANLIGLLGFKPPTKDMNVTVALSLMSIILIEMAGIRNVRAKCLRSNNPVNVVKATFEGLKTLRTEEEVAKTRGLEPGTLLK